ncbi:MAG: hypothetical protein ACPGAF_06535 [Pseudohongiellaceae bacterium]|jgi:hypothetical protein
MMRLAAQIRVGDQVDSARTSTVHPRNLDEILINKVSIWAAEGVI